MVSVMARSEMLMSVWSEVNRRAHSWGIDWAIIQPTVVMSTAPVMVYFSTRSRRS